MTGLIDFFGGTTELISTLTLFISASAALIAAITGVVQSIRSKKNATNVEAELKSLAGRLENIEIGTKELLGNAIDRAYFQYKEKGCIPISAKVNLDHIYIAYKNLHGNSEREKHYTYICGLKVVDDD